jgi:hypothetical protein
MTDHLNTHTSHAVTLTPAMRDAGHHVCPEGDGRIVGPGTEGWEECQCREKIESEFRQ